MNDNPLTTASTDDLIAELRRRRLPIAVLREGTVAAQMEPRSSRRR